MTPAQMRRANKSARCSWAQVKNAVVPRLVIDILLPSDSVLDFGAGPEALHARWLRWNGFNVMAHEIGMNRRLDHGHNGDRQYDVVYASNVLNVQPDEAHINRVAAHLAMLARKIVVVNYPTSPRYSGVSEGRVEEILRRRFSRVVPSWRHVWVCIVS